MENRAEKIIRTAVQLAEEGGFQNVRLRDVAASSGVSLATVYSRFRSKEDLLVAALQSEMGRIETMMNAYSVGGETVLDRVVNFFSLATRALVSRPKFARAVLRSVSSGVPETSVKVLNFQDHVARFILAAMHGVAPEKLGDAHFDPIEARVAFMLEQAWFACLIGWMSDARDEAGVLSQMRETAELLILGMQFKMDAAAAAAADVSGHGASDPA